MNKNNMTVLLWEKTIGNFEDVDLDEFRSIGFELVPNQRGFCQHLFYDPALNKSNTI
jgi:hypothetical protein